MEKMVFDFWAILIAAIIPLLVGMVWYNPKVFGNAWMNSAGMTDEDVKGGNMGLIFGLCFFFSILMGTAITMIVIHQNGLFSTFGNPEDEASLKSVLAFLNENHTGWGAKFRDFGHGAFHGVLTGVFLIMPILATNAMFERKGFKYIAINSGYWIVSLALMGGFICHFSGTFM